MRRAINWLMTLIAVAAIAGLLYAAFRPKPIDVDVVTVERGELVVTVDEDGRTRIRERYTITAPLTGRLLRIQLEPGDNARAGQTLLAAIEPRDPELLDPRAHAEAEARVKAALAAVEQSESETRRAEALLEQATRDRQRVTKLVERGATAERELRDAVTLERVRRQEHAATSFAHQIASFQLEQAKAALLATRSGARDAETRFEIHAPCDGRVLRVLQESAGIVTPGTPLLEFGDASDLECVVDVLSVDAVRIEPGDPVRITRWGGDRPLSATVRVVEPSAFTKVSALGVEEQRVNVIIDFTDPADTRGGLGDGYRIDASVIVDHQRDVLKAPTSALFRSGDRWAVYRVVEDRAVLTPVTLGAQTSLEARVADGLSEGDRVVNYPSDRLTEGALIRPRD